MLHEVYGIASSEYHLGDRKKLDPDFYTYKLIKTHLLPHQLPEVYQSAKSVYLIRDGRDAAISLAHHRKDLKNKSSGFNRNLFEIIMGIGNRFSGGWSGHVRSWASKADIVIRFEDLILNPIEQMERLRLLMELPPPQLEKLPSFQSQKTGIPKYGSGDDFTHQMFTKKEHSQKFYRRGKVGSYKDEMPMVFQFLFWLKNRRLMNQFNYYQAP